MGTGINFEYIIWGTKLGSEKHFSKEQNATCSYGNLNSYYTNYLYTTLVLSAVLLAVVAERIQMCTLPNCATTPSC